MTGVRDRVPFAIGQELFLAHIDTRLLASREMLNAPLGIYSKLAIVAIDPFDEANALDLLRMVFLDALPSVADQAQAANATAIREGDVPAVRLQLPGYK